jgi:hypothetical protein
MDGIKVEDIQQYRKSEHRNDGVPQNKHIVFRLRIHRYKRIECKTNGIVVITICMCDYGRWTDITI